MAVVQQKILALASVPFSWRVSDRGRQPQVELPVLGHCAEEVKVSRSPWLDWCPQARGTAPRYSASPEPQNYQLATPGCRVTSLNLVTPSSPVLRMQHTQIQKVLKLRFILQ